MSGKSPSSQDLLQDNSSYIQESSEQLSAASSDNLLKKILEQSSKTTLHSASRYTNNGKSRSKNSQYFSRSTQSQSINTHVFDDHKEDFFYKIKDFLNRMIDTCRDKKNDLLNNPRMIKLINIAKSLSQHPKTFKKKQPPLTEDEIREVIENEEMHEHQIQALTQRVESIEERLKSLEEQLTRALKDSDAEVRHTFLQDKITESFYKELNSYLNGALRSEIEAATGKFQRASDLTNPGDVGTTVLQVGSGLVGSIPGATAVVILLSMLTQYLTDKHAEHSAHDIATKFLFDETVIKALIKIVVQTWTSRLYYILDELKEDSRKALARDVGKCVIKYITDSKKLTIEEFLNRLLHAPIHYANSIIFKFKKFKCNKDVKYYPEFNRHVPHQGYSFAGIMTRFTLVIKEEDKNNIQLMYSPLRHDLKYKMVAFSITDPLIQEMRNDTNKTKSDSLPISPVPEDVRQSLLQRYPREIVSKKPTVKTALLELKNAYGIAPTFTL